MSDRSDEEIERLANRLALLVSDTGEADNAGRAAGALARRMGLSGGDLKAIFLAGATARPRGERKADDRRGDTPEVAAMGRQISALRHSLTLAEVTARKAELERDSLRKENEALKAAAAVRRGGRVILPIAASTLLTAALAFGVYSIVGPALRPSPAAQFAPADATVAAVTRIAVVRGTGARLFSMPNRGSAIITSVPPGTHLPVKRLVVNVLTQWAEVQFGTRDGFVATTDVDIP